MDKKPQGKFSHAQFITSMVIIRLALMSINCDILFHLCLLRALLIWKSCLGVRGLTCRIEIFCELWCHVSMSFSRGVLLMWKSCLGFRGFDMLDI